MQESKNLVFILGAGSSAGYGPPVMNDFMNTARRRWAQLHAERSSEDFLRKCYDALLEFYEKCRASTWAFKRDWENMEELYTQADLRRLASTAGSQEAEAATDLCDKIAWTIWDVYRECKTVFPLWRICKSVFEADLNPVIITTNYDLVCEVAKPEEVTPLAKCYYPGFGYLEGPEHSISEDQWNPAALKYKFNVPIIKLHGSVNWFHSRPGGKWIFVRNLSLFCDGGRDFHTISEAVCKKAPDSLGDNPENIAPAIIPPMLGKTSVSNVITRQWKAAIDAIAQARQIWVIGYSFPTTDAFMTRLLTEGMQQNWDFEQLVIVDIQPWSKWQPRIEETLGAMLGERKLHFRSLDSHRLHSIMGGQSGTKEWLEQSLAQARMSHEQSGDWAYG